MKIFQISVFCLALFQQLAYFVAMTIFEDLNMSSTCCFGLKP